MFQLRVAVLWVLCAVSPMGVVEGLVPCGADGKVLEVRVTDCSRLPCQLSVGRTYDIEIDFEPAGTHTSLLVRVSVIRGGQETVLVNDEIPAVVSPGNGYTLAYPWTVRGDIFGLVSLRIQLFNDEITEICGLATADIRQAISIPM
ncbi:unnamed protein product [Allacma fusca]|uniref:MD-2-related lipid-recognition domain-containing protein n=1 Tax=Allacma fusca TaxID=39272 RepID=A0A8J2JSE0_9HEXA|nr:unnamed protein product [Allacma fusca]